MISIDYRDPRPIYEQLEKKLRRMILTGAIAANEKLPSVRELAGELAINPNTIQRAYSDLEAQGWIYSVAGKGSFAAMTEQAIFREIQKVKDSFSALASELSLLGVSKEEMIRLIGEAENRD